MSELNSANNEGQRVKTAQSRYFGLFDNLLDKANSGPTYLSEPAIAKIVVDSLHYLDSRDWTLISFCIMPNHVHLVVEKPEKELFRILQSHKRHTARESDKLLNRTGNFWQAESYDHCVRDGNELERIIKYVLNNPVKAALVKSWEDWPHSYCKPALNPM
ncbi:MAG: transposase [Bacteroidia bacterium]